MKLITEVIEDGFQIIQEENDPKKSLHISGIFMQSDIKNRNGRVYPKAIMEKEVNRYINTHVKNNRALGELSHPACFHETTEALTYEGWKKIKDIEEGEYVLTFNTMSRNAEYQKVIGTYKDHYEGVMYSFNNRTLNTVVTPNHRFLLQDRNGGFVYKTSEEIHQLLPTGKLRHHKLIRTSSGIFPKEERETIQIGANTFDFDIFCKFLGFYLSEGCVEKRKNRPNNYRVVLFQNEGLVADEMRKTLEEMNLSYKEIRKERVNATAVSLHITNMDLANYLTTFGVCYDKYIDRNVLNLMDSISATYFLEAFIMGDGRGKLSKKYTSCDVFSTSEKLIDDIIQVASVAGLSAKKHTTTTKKDYLFADRIIKAENKKPLHFAVFVQTSGVYLDPRFLKIEKVDNYSDKVYCIETENSNFFARDGNTERGVYSFWTGNSPKINEDRVSHMITELKQDGSDFVGKAKILSTPMGNIARALIEDGVKIGVSSRGLGSLKEKNGVNEVQSDFHLASIDIVTDPSGPNCFVNGIMEGVDFWYDPSKGIWLQTQLDTIAEQVEETKKEVKRMTRRQIAEGKLQFFENYLNKLKTFD